MAFLYRRRPRNIGLMDTFMLIALTRILSVSMALSTIAEQKGLAGFPTMDSHRQAIQAAVNIDWPVHISAQLISEQKDTVNELNDDSNVITKTIHFQRHGQGFHNLLGLVWKEHGQDIDIHSTDPQQNPYVRPELLDSPLTHHGRQEAISKQPIAQDLEVDAVFVSPLVRTLQTAQLTFDHYYKNDNIPWRAHEACREDMGLYSCNQCRPLSQTMAEYPRIDFDNCSYGENDDLFDATQSEPHSQQAQRIFDFLLHLRDSPEESVAVVTHSAWLFCAFNCVLDCCEDEYLTTWFSTSEIRSVQLSFRKKD